MAPCSVHSVNVSEPGLELGVSREDFCSPGPHRQQDWSRTGVLSALCGPSQVARVSAALNLPEQNVVAASLPASYRPASASLPAYKVGRREFSPLGLGVRIK